MGKTEIEWADFTFNPFIGCTKVSPGCQNCYAERRSHRFPEQGQWGPGAPRKRTSVANWRKPLAWAKAARALGTARDPGWNGALSGHYARRARPRVFCASLADWLDHEAPAEWLADLLALISQTPELDWLLLTKRPQLWRERVTVAMAGCFDEDPLTLMESWLGGDPPSNVWVGTSVEDQRRADERIPRLLEIPARVRFLSCEPLLGPVELPRQERLSANGLTTAEVGNWGNVPAPRFHWVIAGGESGPGARPMQVEHARSLRDQCAEAGVSFFMKQMGGTRKPFHEIPDDLMLREFPHAW